MISDFKNRITFLPRPELTQSPGGGLQVVESDCCEDVTKYAIIESRSGFMQTDSAQREWNYDFKITTRYTKSFVERGGDMIRHEGKTLIVRSVSFDGEGAKRLVILRCSVNE